MVATRRVAKALLFNSSGDFLLLRRSDTHPSLAGLYDLPGGTIETYEEPGTAVVREILEETGIVLAVEAVNMIYTTTQLLHGRSYPTFLYIAHLNHENPEVTISWEHKSHEWAPLARLAEVEPQLAPTYRDALEYIQANDIIQDIGL